jgi:flagellar protein FliO/FliZ
MTGRQTIGSLLRTCGLTLLAGLLLTGLAWSADTSSRTSQLLPPRTSERKPTDPKTTAAAPKTRSTTANWWTSLGGLVAVLALVLLSAKLLRKSLPAAQKGLPPEVIRVLGRKPLDYRHTIHLVRCGSKLLVLGSSQEGLTTLSEITDPVEIDYLAGMCESRESQTLGQGFGQFFRKYQNAGPVEAEEPVELPAEREPDAAVLRLQQRLNPSDRTAARDLAGIRPEEAG